MRDWLNRTRLQRPVWPHRTSDLRLKLGDIRVRHHLGAVRCQFALPVSYRRRRLGNPCAAKSGKCGPADVICHDRPIRPDDVTASATPLRGRLAPQGHSTSAAGCDGPPFDRKHSPPLAPIAHCDDTQARARDVAEGRQVIDFCGAMRRRDP
jgi:hypothetical protein